MKPVKPAGGPSRILRIITRLNAGGPARHVVWVERGLSRRGYVTELLAGRVEGEEDDLSSIAGEEGVEVTDVPRLAREKRPAADAASVRIVAGMIRRFDPDVVHTHTAKAGLVGREEFLIGMIGRIAPVKDYPLFLRAAAIVSRRSPGARFVIVGGGDGEASLREQATELGIAGRVFFLGLRTDLPAIYADLDAVALTSRNEGTPLSLIEAMAAGRPVVATDVGGVRDLLTTEWEGGVRERRFLPSEEPRAIVVSGRSPEEIAAALLRLSTEPALCRSLGEAGYRYAHRFHSVSRLLDDLEGVYGAIGLR